MTPATNHASAFPHPSNTADAREATADRHVAQVAHVVAVVLTGLSAGFFVAYESSVTRGLAEVDDLTYVHTFQAINETVQNPLFGSVFFGSLPALALVAFLRRGSEWTLRRALLAAAPVLYVIGMALTVSGNVPLNDELAEVDATTAAIASDAREAFEDDWNRWNAARTFAFVGAFTAVVAALPLAGRPTRK